MPFMTRIPSDLARFGLRVELVPGWETRGSSSFAPACVVDHWTAGPRGTTGRPSLGVVTNGRAGLPGPLCNVYLGRDGTCVVVAAGRANHAGAGGFRGLAGNSAAYGIEAECGGDGDWTPEMLAAYPRLNAALLSGLGRDASWVAGHNEWAPDRKIDIRDVIASVRAQTGAVLAGGGDDVSWNDVLGKSGEYGPGPAGAWLVDTRVGVGEIEKRLQALDRDLRGDLANKQKLLEQSAQREAGMLAALDVLAKAAAAGGGSSADELRQVIREEMAKVVDVQISVRDDAPAPTS